MSIEFCQALFRVWASMLSSMSSISWQWLITMLNYPYIWGLKNPLGLIVSSRYFLIQFVSNLLWVLNKVNKEFWSLVFSCYNTFILSRCKDELSSSFIFKKKVVWKLYCFFLKSLKIFTTEAIWAWRFLFGKILNFESKCLFLLGSVLVTCIFKEMCLTCFNLQKYCHTFLYNILLLNIF